MVKVLLSTLLTSGALAGSALAGSALAQAPAVQPPAMQAPAARASASPSDEPPAVVVADRKSVRTIDCHGGDLDVNGSDNTLTVSGCSAIVLQGDRNRVRVRLLYTSSISAFGSDNIVHFTAAPGSSPRVASSGARNEINPEFSPADSQPRPFVPRPKSGTR